MNAFKNILVSLLMLSLTGYAVWFTYNQILLDQEQMAKDRQETQRLLQEAREYKAKIAPEIEALEKGVKQLQDEFTASFGSSFSDTPVVKRTTYNKLDSDIGIFNSDPDTSTSEYQTVDYEIQERNKLRDKVIEKCKNQVGLALAKPNNEFLVNNAMDCLDFYAEDLQEK